jgi:predicted permease
VDLMLSFTGLGFPILIGIVAGGSQVFPDADAAIHVLNRYALYIAFPALIAAGLTGQSFSLPLDVGFWLIVPVAMAVTGAFAGLLGLWSPLKGHGGTLAMVGIFGNVAYVGLPMCERILGESSVGLASLAVSVFVLVSLLIGPMLLLAWTPGASGEGSPWKMMLRQPLLWSPLVGLGLRWTPWMGGAHDLLAPIGRSAAPVALFLLGLYLYENRRAAMRPGLSSVAHVVQKLLVFPLVLTGLCLLCLRAEVVQRDAAQVFILLGATPTAIATFALSVDFDAGQEQVAQSIVLTTLASMVTLPLVSIWVLTL